MDLSNLARDTDSRGFKANRSLSSTLAWAASCNCYYVVWASRDRLWELSFFKRSYIDNW